MDFFWWTGIEPSENYSAVAKGSSQADEFGVSATITRRMQGLSTDGATFLYNTYGINIKR
jgi:hypothetical protein